MLRQFCKQVLAVQTRQKGMLWCTGSRTCSTQMPQDASEPEEEEGSSMFKEASFCDVSMLGRVGTSPKLIHVPATGSDFVNFVIGTYSGEATKWHDVNVNKQATVKWLMESVDVGDRLYVKGKLSYMAQANVKHYRIYADDVKLINRSQKNWQKRSEHEAEG